MSIAKTKQPFVNMAVQRGPQNKTMETTVRQFEAYSKAHASMLAAAMLMISEKMIINVTVAAAPIGKGDKPATQCDSVDYPQRGTRKWVTEYQIFTYAERIAVGLTKFDYLGMDLVKGGIESKTEAVKEAKRLAIKHGVPMMVQIHKMSVDDDNVALICEPKMKKKVYLVEYISKL
ncbi:hypothetical protein ACK8P5_26430 (plasmid) [Paenibacillus sp. EC2-1]|uniref:hypothetical protein n=1 Tax=Paenibacillus sp. EC2-1 TaxID=3388665 RepID=UPI003BEEF19F